MLLGSGGLLEEMAETKDVLAKGVVGEDLITEVNAAGGAGGTHTLAGVFTMCGGVCTVERELGLPREFTIFVEFLTECFKDCPLKELFDVCIFWTGLSTGVASMLWPLLRTKGGPYFGLVEIRRTWLPAPRPCGGTINRAPFIMI